MNNNIRSRLSIRAAFLAIAMWAWSLTSGMGQQMTLRDCILVTLKQHPNSTIYANNVRISEERIRESRSAQLPTIAGVVNTDYNVKLQTSVIPAGTFGTEETKLQMGNKFSSGASLQGDLNLVNLSTALSVKSAKVDRDIASLTALSENETLVYNTAKAYYDVLTFGQKGRLLRDNEKQYKQLLEILKLRYEQGAARKTEYDRTRVNLNNIQAELKLNDSNTELALNKLKNAMGMDVQATLAIDDSIQYRLSEVQLPASEDFRPQSVLAYQIDEQRLRLDEFDVKSKHASFYPTLSLSAKYGANAYGADLSSAYTQWFDYSSIGIKLSVPIYSGFKKSSQVAQSKISLENRRLTLRLNASNYQLDYQNSTSQLLTSYHSLMNNKDNLDLAKSVLDATALEYKEGTTDLSSFMDADRSYREAQTNYTTALLDFLTAQLSREKAKGTLTAYVNQLK